MESYKGFEIKNYENYRFAHLFKVEQDGKQQYPYLFQSLERAKKSVDVWLSVSKDLTLFNVSMSKNMVLLGKTKHIEKYSIISKIVKYILRK